MATKAEITARLAEVEGLIANGLTGARDSDGKSVTYRTLGDLYKMKEQLLNQLRNAKGTRRHMGRTILVSRGL